MGFFGHFRQKSLIHPTKTDRVSPRSRRPRAVTRRRCSHRRSDSRFPTPRARRRWRVRVRISLFPFASRLVRRRPLDDAAPRRDATMSRSRATSRVEAREAAAAMDDGWTARGFDAATGTRSMTVVERKIMMRSCRVVRRRARVGREANGWGGWWMVWDKRLTLTLRGAFFARSRYRRALERGVRRPSGAKQGSSRAFVSRGAYVQQGAQV